MLPRLLVSVQSPEEAVAAVSGGAQIIDVKNPFQGPLGRADVATVQQILAVVRQSSPLTPVSAALGEIHEWLVQHSTGHRDWVQFLKDRSPLQFLKLGPAGSGAAWEASWRAARRMVRPQESGSDSDARCESGSMPGSGGGKNDRIWMAVAYADAERSGSDSVLRIARASVGSGCRGVLIDTFIKDGSGLLHWMSLDELTELRRLTYESDLLLALAGQLREADLPYLADVVPDVIAVRGAVCRQGQREQVIEEQLVRELVATIRCIDWHMSDLSRA